MRHRPGRWSMALLAVAASAVAVEAGVSVVGVISSANHAQRNESAAISALQAEEAKVSTLEAAIASLPAADRAAVNAAVAGQFSRGAARPEPPTRAAPPRGATISTAPPTTTTTTRPAPPPQPAPAPAPPPPPACTAVPVVGLQVCR